MRSPKHTIFFLVDFRAEDFTPYAKDVSDALEILPRYVCSKQPWGFSEKGFPMLKGGVRITLRTYGMQAQVLSSERLPTSVLEPVNFVRYLQKLSNKYSTMVSVYIQVKVHKHLTPVPKAPFKPIPSRYDRALGFESVPVEQKSLV